MKTEKEIRDYIYSNLRIRAVKMIGKSDPMMRIDENVGAGFITWPGLYRTITSAQEAIGKEMKIGGRPSVRIGFYK